MPKKQTDNTRPWESLATEAVDSLTRRDGTFEKFASARLRSDDAIAALKASLRAHASKYSEMDAPQRASFDFARRLFEQAEVNNAVEQSIKLSRLEAKLTQQPAPRNGAKEEARA